MSNQRQLTIARVDKNTMAYKRYIGKIEFDNEAGIFHGEVINLRDVITFQGGSVSELRKALEDSIEDYLEFCAERGEVPEKSFSGKFIIRISPELHRKIYIQAKRADVSLNQWVKDVLEQALA